jgi:quercetin dioxygenase-like cupin family protein
VSGALTLTAGEGERYAMGASEVVIKATGADTGGAFFVAEVVLEGGFPGPPAHWHEHLHETLYVLEGELTLTLADDVCVLGPGGFASIPPRTVHTFRNDGAAPVRGLNVNAPAGWEDYLRELAGAAGSGGLTPALMAQIASRHDFHRA